MSRQFQISIAHGNFNFTHGNLNLITAILICSRQFQFAHGDINLLKAISIFSRQRSRGRTFPRVTGDA